MQYDKNNIFAKIIRGEIPAGKVYEDDKILAFKDVAPAAPIHILVVPKGEYISFDDFAAKAGAEELAYFFKKVQDICESLNISSEGYRIMANVGKNGMQTVPHMHLHILAGKMLGRTNP